MAETNDKNTSKNPEFAIQRLFVKDISFEAPNSPQAFKEEWKPEVEVNLDTVHQLLEGELYDVTLKVTVTTKLNSKTIFVAEVQQAGIFMLNGFEQTQHDELLGSFCANVLFPYAREVISDIVNRGGFPPLYLAPVNFDAIYQQRKQKAAAND